MRKIINYFVMIASIIIYVSLLFFYQMDSNYLKEIKYVYILAIPCFIILISSFLSDNQKWKRKNLSLYLVIYLIVLMGFVFSNARTVNSYITSGIKDYNYNLIPFHSIMDMLNSPLGLKFGLYNILGNFFMLTPLSVLLPLLNNKFKKIDVFLGFIIIFTLVIECIQLILNVGSFDIDDFILNVGGSLLTFILVNKTGLLNIFNKVFIVFVSKKRYVRLILNIIYSLLIIIFLISSGYNIYLITYDYSIRNPKIDYSTLVCLENKKTHIIDYNNYHYYSNCNYGTGEITIGDKNSNIKDFITSNLFDSKYENELGISKEEIITDIKLKINNKLGKKLITVNHLGDKIYFYNIESMEVIQDGNSYDYEKYLEDLKNKNNNVEIDLSGMSNIIYVHRNNEYSIEKGKYYQVLNCRIGNIYHGVNYNYYIPLSYEINDKSCNNLNNN